MKMVKIMGYKLRLVKEEQRWFLVLKDFLSLWLWVQVRG